MSDGPTEPVDSRDASRRWNEWQGFAPRRDSNGRVTRSAFWQWIALLVIGLSAGVAVAAYFN